jgi:hypothetical protein
VVAGFERACKIMFHAPQVRFNSFRFSFCSLLDLEVYITANSILKIAAVNSSGIIKIRNHHGAPVIAMHSIA